MQACARARARGGGGRTRRTASPRHPSPALGCCAVSMAAAASGPTLTRRLEPIKVK